MDTYADKADVPTGLRCARCASELHPGTGNFYRITIEAACDPWPPMITEADLARDVRAEIERLLNRMSSLSEQEAMDQVYRRLHLHLCGSCYRQWIANPTGGGASVSGGGNLPAIDRPF